MYEDLGGPAITLPRQSKWLNWARRKDMGHVYSGLLYSAVLVLREFSCWYWLAQIGNVRKRSYINQYNLCVILISLLHLLIPYKLVGIMVTDIVATKIILFLGCRYFVCHQQIIYFNNDEPGLRHRNSGFHWVLSLLICLLYKPFLKTITFRVEISFTLLQVPWRVLWLRTVWIPWLTVFWPRRCSVCSWLLTD